MSLEVNFFAKLGSGLIFTKYPSYKHKQGVLKNIFDYYKLKNLPERSMGKSCLTYEEIKLANSTLSLSELINFMKDFNIVPNLLTINGLNFAWQRQRQKCEEYLFKSNRIDFPNFIEILARCAVLAYDKPVNSHLERAQRLVSFLNLEDSKLIEKKLKKLSKESEKRTTARPIVNQVTKVFRKRRRNKHKKIYTLFESFKSDLELFENSFKLNRANITHRSISYSNKRGKKDKNRHMRMSAMKQGKSMRKSFKNLLRRKLSKAPPHAKVCFLSGSLDSQFSIEALKVFKKYSNTEKVPDFPWRELFNEKDRLSLQVILNQEYDIKLQIKNLYSYPVFNDFRIDSLSGCSIEFDGLSKTKGLVCTAILKIEYSCETQETGTIQIIPRKRNLDGKLVDLLPHMIHVTIIARKSKVLPLGLSPSDQKLLA